MRASQLAVYETYENIYGQRSSLDELVAEIEVFNQKSVLWVCAVIITGMQLWNRINSQPLDVFETLVKLYFDRTMHGRLLAGYWATSPRRVLFHRRQVLLIAKLAIKHCSEIGMDARVHAGRVGVILLKANDQFSYGLLDEFAKNGGLVGGRDELSRIIAEMLAVGESVSPSIPFMITRSHLMMTRFAAELRNHPDWIDVVGEYERFAGLSLGEYEAMIVGTHARFGPELSRSLYREPGRLPLKEENFATTAIDPPKVSAFIDLFTSSPPLMAEELKASDNGPNDFTIFRKYPLVTQFYNLHLTTAWCGFLMMDNNFFLEKVVTGPYWYANGRHGQKLHRFWGAVFEEYVNELMRRACRNTKAEYIPDPRRANQPNHQICDGIVVDGDCLVLIECKGNVFRADTKYSGNYKALAAEIEKKLVTPRGVAQLAKAVRDLFGPSGHSIFPQVDLKKIKRVYPYLVTLDSIGATIGMPMFLNTFLDEELDRNAYPTVEIRPLFCINIETLEESTKFFQNSTLPAILEEWFASNPSLFTPLSAVDLNRFDGQENEWLRSEWTAIYRNIARVLFPNEARMI